MSAVSTIIDVELLIDDLPVLLGGGQLLMGHRDQTNPGDPPGVYLFDS